MSVGYRQYRLQTCYWSILDLSRLTVTSPKWIELVSSNLACNWTFQALRQRRKFWPPWEQLMVRTYAWPDCTEWVGHCANCCSLLWKTCECCVSGRPIIWVPHFNETFKRCAWNVSKISAKFMKTKILKLKFSLRARRWESCGWQVVSPRTRRPRATVRASSVVWRNRRCGVRWNTFEVFRCLAHRRTRASPSACRETWRARWSTSPSPPTRRHPASPSTSRKNANEWRSGRPNRNALERLGQARIEGFLWVIQHSGRSYLLTYLLTCACRLMDWQADQLLSSIPLWHKHSWNCWQLL